MVNRQQVEQTQKPLPPPWDRIFSLGSRIFVWGLLFSILYILRPFFLLVFMTFVFAYVLEHGVQGLQHRIRNRPLRVVMVTAVFLGALVTAVIALVPAFSDQAGKLAKEYPKYLASIDSEIAKTREKNKWTHSFLPQNLRAADVLEYLLGFVNEGSEEAVTPAETSAPPAPVGVGDGTGDGTGSGGETSTDGSGGEGDTGMGGDATGTEPGPTEGQEPEPGRTPDEPTPAPGGEERGGGEGAAVVTPARAGEPVEAVDRTGDDVAAGQDPRDGPGTPVVPTPTATASSKKQNLADAMELLKNVASPILGFGSAFLLSLLFSFLIVLDLPKLSRAVSGLANTKIGFIYDEVAGNIHDFGKMLGRALEAQLFIAMCNTILTAIGLYFLGLHENLVFLSTIVFFCSFIPVAGVFLSSTPICLEALSDSGVQMMVLAIGMILIIHFIEAYFLNPKIFGHHLHMNAVLVLIVLTIAGKLFGVWGLILGLPVVNYVFGHAIRYKKPKKDPKGVAA